MAAKSASLTKRETLPGRTGFISVKISQAAFRRIWLELRISDPDTL
jgi:hypothetical protein